MTNYNDNLPDMYEEGIGSGIVNFFNRFKSPTAMSGERFAGDSNQGLSNRQPTHQEEQPAALDQDTSGQGSSRQEAIDNLAKKININHKEIRPEQVIKQLVKPEFDPFFSSSAGLIKFSLPHDKYNQIVRGLLDSQPKLEDTESIQEDNEPEITFEEYIDILNSVGDDEVLSDNLVENNYSNAKMSKYMGDRYKNRRKELIKSMGGKCVLCGSTKNLEIDHKKRDGTKVGALAKMSSASNEKWEAESRKCQILCKSCHRKKTTKQFKGKKAKKKTVKETFEAWREERELNEAKKGYEEFLAKRNKNK